MNTLPRPTRLLPCAVGCLAPFTVLLIATIAQGETSAVRLTTARTRFNDPAIAAGPPGYMVAWGQRESQGQEAVDPKIGLALLDPSGKVLEGPRFAAGLEFHLAQLLPVWNGRGFTLVICTGRHPTKGESLLVWGTVDADATFHESGRYTVDTPQISCTQPIAEGDHVVVGIQVDGREGRDAKDVTAADCYVRFVALGEHEAKPATKDLKLCTALARGQGRTLGQDYRDASRLVEDGGMVSKAKGVLSAIAASPLGTGFVVLDDGRLLGLDAKLKVEQSHPFEAHLPNPHLMTLRPDLVALYNRSVAGLHGVFATPQGEIKQKFDVPLSGQAGDPSPLFIACAGRAEGFGCAYVTGKGEAQDLYFREIPAPRGSEP